MVAPVAIGIVFIDVSRIWIGIVDSFEKCSGFESGLAVPEFLVSIHCFQEIYGYS